MHIDSADIAIDAANVAMCTVGLQGSVVFA
jgi:hypothetical protein